MAGRLKHPFGFDYTIRMHPGVPPDRVRADAHGTLEVTIRHLPKTEGLHMLVIRAHGNRDLVDFDGEPSWKHPMTLNHPNPNLRGHNEAPRQTSVRPRAPLPEPGHEVVEAWVDARCATEDPAGPLTPGPRATHAIKVD